MPNSSYGKGPKTMRKYNIIKGLLEELVFFIQYHDSLGKIGILEVNPFKILALLLIYESKKIIWAAFSQ